MAFKGGKATSAVKAVVSVFRKPLRILRLAYLSVGHSKECPICNWSGRDFLRRSRRHKPAPSEICPRCGSFARHRFAYWVLKDRLPRRVESALHFAPERCVEPWLRSISDDYLSVDLCASNAMARMDITNLRLEADQFSLIWCSHVLEHIEDDAKAMTELYRVLKHDGLLVLMVPVYGDKTYENPEVRTPQERLEHFRQEDHVRLYGLDIADRLRRVGFSVDVLTTSALQDTDKETYGLEYPSTREVFLCVKPWTCLTREIWSP